jgi:hypothetical protein
MGRVARRLDWVEWPEPIDDGVWRIASLRLTRLLLRPIEGEPPPPMTAGVVSSRGRNWLAGLPARGDA